MTKSYHLLNIFTLVCFISVLIESQSYGATTTATMAVSVNVVGDCTVSASPFVFSDYDPSGGQPALDQVNAITVQCANEEAYKTALSTGYGTYTQRLMKNAGNPDLNYQLYTDLARAHVWGDGSGSTTLPEGAGTGFPQILTVYGTIPASQTTIPSGLTYTDSITVTVSY